jgi:hypothetical protein
MIVSWGSYHLISKYDALEAKNILAGKVGLLGFGVLLCGLIYSHVRENKRSSQEN